MSVLGLKSCAGTISLLLFLFGLYTVLLSSEKNKCEMTYMFEKPQYIRIPLESNTTHRFPQYQLFVYGEGYAEELRSGDLDGLPVLFVPGSGGSHRQVRSLASLALRMAQSRRSHQHFDFFALDTNRELSALYGGVLWDQTFFLRDCVRHIMRLYALKGLNRTVTIIGHSMGGVVAQALLLLPLFDAKSISLIITLSSPHRFPVVALDSHASVFYQRLKQHGWEEGGRGPLVVSVAGGSRDLLVRSDLTTLQPQQGLSLHTLSIPGVWLSTDHLCILWCKQLVKGIIRVLFQLIDKEQYQIHADRVFQRRVLEDELVRGVASLPLPSSGGSMVGGAPPPPRVHFSQAGEWILKEEASWRIQKNKVLQAVNILVPLRTDEQIVIHTLGVDHLNWAFSCQILNDSDVCLEGVGLSSLAQAVPSLSIQDDSSPARLLFVTANHLKAKGHTHLLIYLVPSIRKVNVVVESYKRSVRHKIVVLPSIVRGLLTWSPLRMLTVPLSEGALFYNVSLRGLELPWQSYSFHLERRVCRVGFSGSGLIRFHIPWSSEDQYYSTSSILHSKTEITCSLSHGRGNSSSLAQLHLLLSPECSYSLTVDIKISSLAAQFVRFYLPLLSCYLSAALLVALSHQLYSLATKGLCPSLLSSLGDSQTFLALVVGPEILHYALKWWGNWIPFLPTVDDQTLEENNLHFLLLRLALFSLGHGCLLVLVLTTTAFFTLAGVAIIWVMNRYSLPISYSSHNSLVLDPRRVVVLCFLAAIGMVSCGALALLLTVCWQVGQLMYLCGRNCHEEQRRGPSPSSGRWHLQHTLLHLLFACLLLSLPSLGHWAGLERWHLIHDPHKASIFILLLSGAILYQEGVPVTSRCHYRLMSVLVLVLSILVCSFCLLHTWRILHFLATVQALLAAQQLAARLKDKAQ